VLGFSEYGNESSGFMKGSGEGVLTSQAGTSSVEFVG
jgi:hypothetical protein